MSKQKEDRSGQNMEEKILSAAENLFFRKGYYSTSTTEIARKAGCNQALVHYYFRTKEKLFHAVLGGKVKSVLKEFLSVEAGEGGFEQKLAKLVETHYDAVRKHSDVVLFLMNEMWRNPELLESLIAEMGDIPVQILSQFKRDLDEEIKAGRVRPISISQLVLNVISINAFAFAIKPVYAKVWDMKGSAVEDFFDERRKEVVMSVLNSLRP